VSPQAKAAVSVLVIFKLSALSICVGVLGVAGWELFGERFFLTKEESQDPVIHTN